MYIKENKISKRFIIIYTLFIIALIYVTALGIYFSIDKINNTDQTLLESVISNVVEEKKKIAQDTKYAINSFDETYDFNSLLIIDTFDIDGRISTENNIPNPTYRIHFIQIDGLKNKDIQYRINEKLKQKAYTLAFYDSFVDTNVTANFANMLSVLISSEKGVETLNIDLSTGNEIPFNDIFISSATINAYLSNALYKTLAWSNLQSGIDTIDMNQIDTSDYEDKFMMLINNYKNNIDNIKYTISPNAIDVYGLIDKNILDVENVQKMSIHIDLIDYINEIAMYKKFLSERNIYDDDSIGIKNTIVFTNNIVANNENISKISYNKLQNNIFIEEYLFGDYEQPEYDAAKEYIKKLSDEQKTNLINQTSNNRGTFFQRSYNITNANENSYYIITVNSYQAMCSINYFNSSAFFDYIKLKAISTNRKYRFNWI